MPSPLPIRVLIVDDSALVRSSYQMLFQEEPGFQVVGEAGDPYEARDKILELSPDVVTLDVEMPRMDGITFLRRIMQHRPTPVVVCSSVTSRGSSAAVEALQIGASEVLEKPTTALGRQQFGPTLRSAVRAASQSHPERRVAAPAEPVAIGDGRFSAALIAIGSSTGGPAHLLELLPRLPKELPPIVIVQHMPSGFTSAFADRIAKTSDRDAREATDGEVLKPGTIRIAPGGRHLALAGTTGSLRLQVKDGPMINFHRPSVDLFFHSTSRICGPAAVGVILTGMGEDGARGLLAMRQAGARTLGQDEASSIVYGMPKAAWEIGAVRTQHSLAALPKAIVEAAKP